MLHTLQQKSDTTYFCTITCYRWLPLFSESNCYDSVYRWFEHLKNDGCYVVAYVIMPNHLHVLLHLVHKGTSLSHLVGPGKRFMAYDIVNALERLKKHDLLTIMKNGVQAKEKMKGKKHQVFRLSFDSRECDTEKMMLQKLYYIHQNPVRGKWLLVDDFADYEHSSACFYELNKPARFPVTHYADLGTL